MNFDQHVPQLSQLGRGGRMTVDLGAAAAIGFDDSTHQHPTGISSQVALDQPSLDARVGGEGGAEVGTRTTLPHHPRVGTATERQAQRIDQDRLAGAGFTGKHREARAEFKVDRFDDDEVAQSQFGQHSDAGGTPSQERRWAKRALNGAFEGATVRQGRGARLGISCQFSFERSVA